MAFSPFFSLYVAAMSLSFCTLCQFVMSENTPGRWCRRGQTCWPTAADIAALSAGLNPSGTRILRWNGPPNPRVSSVPIYSPYDQPLYGLGSTSSLQAVYYADKPITGTCFSTSPETRLVCLAACRNNPLEGWHPAIVVFALNAQHVQTAVRFAVKHNMCINVAGTGHDFINRHSCSEGVFIRTTLLKDIEWDLTDKKGFGHKDGNVRFGAGIVFSEAQKSASDNGRFISSGWAITVGVTGWSIGGGHGPFAPSSGLGVDNILEVEIVTADGNLVTASASNNSDLFWALRGGGGSTWGVITALTLKAHKNSPSGFTMRRAWWVGSMCSADRSRLHTIMDAYLSWALSLNSEWSGVAFFTPSLSDSSQCGGNWSIYMQYVDISPAAQGSATWKNLTDNLPKLAGFKQDHSTTWWEQVQNYALEPIIPVPWSIPSRISPGGVPSVLLSRAEVINGSVAAQIKLRLDDCPNKKQCARQELYQAITGNIGSVQDPNVSISTGFRKALFHFVVGGWDNDTMKTYYKLGGNSYFSESAYDMDGDNWKQRYWGSNYDQLLNIKKKWDPNGVFWCRHCVGSDLVINATKINCSKSIACPTDSQTIATKPTPAKPSPLATNNPTPSTQTAHAASKPTMSSAPYTTSKLTPSAHETLSHSKPTLSAPPEKPNSTALTDLTASSSYLINTPSGCVGIQVTPILLFSSVLFFLTAFF